jgi:hypothetical protein
MKPKSGLYSLMSSAANEPAATAMPVSAARTRIASARRTRSRPVGASSTRPAAPAPITFSRKSVPIVGTAEKYAS